jgi:dTDP-4-dehydrorhamnose 3,5-epimerase-like enzyme
MSATCPTCLRDLNPFSADHECGPWNIKNSPPASLPTTPSSSGSGQLCSLQPCLSTTCPCRTNGPSDEDNLAAALRMSASDSLDDRSSREIRGTLGTLLALREKPEAHPDSRGTVRETYRASWFPEVPPIKQLVQSNSKANVLRGMHLHKKQFDVWRFVSDRAWVRLYNHLTGEQAFIPGDKETVIAIPPGISHGFFTVSGCILVYALTEEYDGTDEYGWYPFDGLTDIEAQAMFKRTLDGWPTTHYGLTVSERDMRAPRLSEFIKQNP